MASTDPLDLARNSIGRLASLTTQVGILTGKRVYGILGGHFCYTSQIIYESSDEDALRGHIAQLLRNTERLCNWPSEPKGKGYPLLVLLASSPDHNDTGVLVMKSLSQLTETKKGDRMCQSMIQYLEKFNAKYCLHRHEEAVETTKGGTVDSKIDINGSAYKILQQHMAQCKCFGASTNGANPHSTHLLLKPPSDSRMEVDDQFQFDILFLSKDVDDKALANTWQQVQLLVPRYSGKKARKQARIAAPEGSTGTHDRQSARSVHTKKLSTAPLPIDQFCKMILSKNHACLRLMLRDNMLHRCNDQPLERILENNPSITLASLLRRFRLPTRTKVILAYILAHSVWWFYSSEWMNVRWTSSTVRFVKECRLRGSTPHVFAWKPYIMAKFGEKDADAAEISDRAEEIHKFPRLRALGIILIEIAKGEPIPVDSEQRIQFNGEYLIYQNAVEDEKLWKDVDIEYEDYHDAINACFDAELFDEVYQNPELTEEEQLQRRRSILYDKIVSPIEELLINVKWMNKLTSIGPLESRKRQSTADIKSIKSPIKSQSTQESLPPKTSKTKVTLSQKAAGDWLRKIDRFHQELASTVLPTVSSRPIRIAVLDTGCDKGSMFFETKENKRRLKGWKDFAADTDKSYQDAHGHGTFMTTLVMRIAPQAHVYVARIAKSEDQLKNAIDEVGENAAKAIDWASRECEADIISMSFGFKQEPLGVSRAIRRALLERDNSILFLAAASNAGALEPERWPAKHESVISMRSANAKGDLQDSNPGKNRGESYIMGTLGVDVPSYGPSEHDNVIYDSGSSVATAVASALAGVLLQYVADKSESRSYEEVNRKMRTRQGMQEMFYNLATSTTKERCMFLDLAAHLIDRNDDDRWARITTVMSDV